MVTFLIATMVSVVLSLALYTVANWRKETESNKSRNTKNILFFHKHCCCEHDSINQQGFVDINNQLTLVSVLLGFPQK